MNIFKYMETYSQQKRIIVFFIVLGIIVIFTGSAFMRPAADDYCFGSKVGQSGILGGTVDWWMEWSGYVFSMFLGNTLVGWPLVHLPWYVASAIPFLSASFFMGIIFCLLSRNNNFFSWETFYVIFIVMFIWSTSLFMDQYLDVIKGVRIELSYALINWQTINGTYIVQMQILFFLFLYFSLFGKNKILEICFSCIGGVLAGTAGTAISLSIFSLFLLVFTFINIYKKHIARQKNITIVVTCIFIVLGVIISHTLSPGHKIRSEIINPDTSMSMERIVYFITFIFPYSIKIFVKLYTSFGMLFVFLASALSYIMFQEFFFKRDFKFAFFSSLALGMTAFLFICIARFSQAFSYEAYWHFATASIFVFFSTVLGGVSSGFLINKYLYRQIQKMLFVLFMVVMLFAIIIDMLSAAKISARADAWIQGPAPVTAVSDIEVPDGWQMNCWKNLDASRAFSTPRKLCQ